MELVNLNREYLLGILEACDTPREKKLARCLLAFADNRPVDCAGLFEEFKALNPVSEGKRL